MYLTAIDALLSRAHNRHCVTTRGLHGLPRVSLTSAASRVIPRTAMCVREIHCAHNVAHTVYDCLSLVPEVKWYAYIYACQVCGVCIDIDLAPSVLAYIPVYPLRVSPVKHHFLSALFFSLVEYYFSCYTAFRLGSWAESLLAFSRCRSYSSAKWVAQDIRMWCRFTVSTRPFLSFDCRCCMVYAVAH